MSNNFTAPTLRRFERALARRRQWDSLLDDAYRYALPNHDPRGAGGNRGGQRDGDVYDNTAVNAVQWKKARLHGQLFPPFREWMDFEPALNAPLSAGDERRWTAYVGQARRKFHQAVELSNFHIEIDPALGDACISTGFLLCHAGSPDDPLRFEAVPAAQFVPEEGPDGLIRTIFRPWSVAGRQIVEKWSDAVLPADTTARIAQDPDGGVHVVEAILHDYASNRSTYEVWLTDAGGGAGEHRLVERHYDVSPGIAFRMDKAPGEWMGRGPVLNVLGDIKTANKVVELILKNASIAVTGIWQADDDGVLNPANIKLVPGAIIPKAMGSSGLTPLAAPGRFDVSQLVLASLQDSIRRGIMGPSLPPASDGVRTAFEIDARRAEHQAVELPMGLRLLSELDHPLANRILAILQSPQMAGSPFYIEPFEIDGEVIRPRPRNPLVRLQDVADAAQAQQAYMAAQAAFPDLVGGIVDRGAYLRNYLEQNGFPPEHFQNPDSQAEFEALVRHKQAAMEAIQRLQQAAPDGVAA